jgi:hypothetical protein
MPYESIHILGALEALPNVPMPCSPVYSAANYRNNARSIFQRNDTPEAVAQREPSDNRAGAVTDCTPEDATVKA